MNSAKPELSLVLPAHNEASAAYGQGTRRAGESKFTLWRMIDFAVSGMG